MKEAAAQDVDTVQLGGYSWRRTTGSEGPGRFSVLDSGAWRAYVLSPQLLIRPEDAILGRAPRICKRAGRGAATAVTRRVERKSFPCVTVFLTLLRNVNWRAASGQSGADFMRSQPIILVAECNPSGQRWRNP